MRERLAQVETIDAIGAEQDWRGKWFGEPPYLENAKPAYYPAQT
jgi:hypothetical protein